MFILPGGGVGGVGLVHKIAAVVVMVGWSCFVGIFYIIENLILYIYKISIIICICKKIIYLYTKKAKE